jgi:L-2-hydroxyglutarate oxidase LhgO
LSPAPSGRSDAIVVGGGIVGLATAYRLLEAFVRARDVPFERCGKLVVAVTASELPRLADLQRRAEANGVPGLIGRRVAAMALERLAG